MYAPYFRLRTLGRAKVKVKGPLVCMHVHTLHQQGPHHSHVYATPSVAPKPGGPRIIDPALAHTYFGVDIVASSQSWWSEKRSWAAFFHTQAGSDDCVVA